MQFNTLSYRLVPALPTKPQNPAPSLGKMNQFSWVIHRNLFTSFTLRLSLPLDQQGEPIHRAAASKGDRISQLTSLVLTKYWLHKQNSQ